MQLQNNNNDIKYEDRTTVLKTKVAVMTIAATQININSNDNDDGAVSPSLHALCHKIHCQRNNFS